MKPLQLEPHLSLDEIANKLSTSIKAHHRSYWQLLLSVTINPHKEAEEYSAFLGIKPSKISHIVQRYNKEGADTFDKKQWGGRRKGAELLTLEEEIVMMASLKEQALQGHILTIHDIREHVETRVNKTVSDELVAKVFRSTGIYISHCAHEHIQADFMQFLVGDDDFVRIEAIGGHAARLSTYQHSKQSH